MAVGTGKKVEFDEKKTGKVVFDGKTHAGSKCSDCHSKPKLFEMKKSRHPILNLIYSLKSFKDISYGY